MTNPTGLTISGSGTGSITLSGTPTGAGTVTFTVTPTDAIGTGAGTTYSFVVNSGVALSASTLPAGEVGLAYTQSITGTGGSGAITLAVSGVTNPTGLTIAGSGTGTISLTGTPTTAGTVTFTVTPTDAIGTGAGTTYSFVVSPGVALSASTLPAGEVGLAYTQLITGTGGSGAITLAVSGVTNPTGLTIAGSGTGTISLTGTPTTAGTVTFTVTPTDAIGTGAGTTYSFVVSPGVALSASTLPAGEVGLAYTQSITGTGGSGAITLAVSGMTNPTGLTISGSGTGSITLSGTPTGAGTVTFTVTPTDAVGTGAGTTYSFAVNPTVPSSPPAPTVTALSPAAGPASGGTTVTIVGTNLNGATAVMFGGALGAIISDTPTQIEATSPAGDTGVIDVWVTTPSGSSSLVSADRYTYIAASPVSPPPTAPPVVPPVVPPTSPLPPTVPPVAPPVVPPTSPLPPVVPPVAPPVVPPTSPLPPTVPPVVPPVTPLPPTVPPAVPPVTPPVVPPTSPAPPVVPPTSPVPPTVPPVPPVNPTPLLVGYSQFATATDVGGTGTVTVYNADQSVAYTATPFGASFTAGVRVAIADFSGGGVPDLVAGTGPGATNQITVLDGKSHQPLVTFSPFESTFTGGVFVTVGDVNGDGVPDLIVTPDQTGGPIVAVYDGASLGQGHVVQLARFFGINDPNFRGGARTAVADINGDGYGDLIVSAGVGGGPRIAIYNGKSVATNTPTELMPDFFAFESSLRNGAYVTAGDLTGKGYADLIFGAGPGGGPRVLAVDGAQLLSAAGSFQSLSDASVSGATVADFFAGDPSNRDGVRLAVADLDGSNQASLVVGSGQGAGATVTAYTGKAIVANPEAPAADFSLDALPAFQGGVFVG
ncbi:beta strand repeat-containing protein [Fimbriiglobus ruber]|uniref:Filamentous hemagglutinin-like protein n=1 Tax=Fimbriiglobus ruber TaxID=1908690 RepID=A0A225DNT1_9BACT|nr:IPT/TIG domain-containing protein [Fimbriiglobus ruber]OWK43062.1 Filamentous hemagglutinin-like protein [Fimbriiglobus ruber]